MNGLVDLDEIVNEGDAVVEDLEHTGFLVTKSQVVRIVLVVSNNSVTARKASVQTNRQWNNLLLAVRLF